MNAKNVASFVTVVDGNGGSGGGGNGNNNSNSDENITASMGGSAHETHQIVADQLICADLGWQFNLPPQIAIIDRQNAQGNQETETIDKKNVFILFLKQKKNKIKGNIYAFFMYIYM